MAEAALATATGASAPTAANVGGGGGRLHLKFGGKLRFGSYLFEMGNFYRVAYRASKNRVVPRASTMGRSGGPGTIDLSCRVGPKHY
jgi:hypothetical protein